MWKQILDRGQNPFYLMLNYKKGNIQLPWALDFLSTQFGIEYPACIFVLLLNDELWLISKIS
ncbi:hypothetical protein LV84_01258 [Algoriphagus ratkowskyi]|uniref:Uncharacterized protein n=1 Tax=Algoriphagus ratkowskyi TaxID=57028 RepID=A0A2W7RE60_9BACT|nr:hypothetical protein LV84_01258 [Algoriphagus ratkowskyi]